MRRFLILITAISLLLAQPAQSARGPGTIEDLKKIEIICFVPTWLPKGFKVESVAIIFDEPGPDEGGGRFPLYSISYTNGRGHTFSIDCAREGIGDRNLLGTDDSEDAEIPSPLGRMFIIYTPKGKAGRKTEIRSNWTATQTWLSRRRRTSWPIPSWADTTALPAPALRSRTSARSLIRFGQPGRKAHHVTRGLR
jgi:hypothetical protein